MLPLLYLHGLSSGDFGPALEQFLGTGAGLSATSITRLTAQLRDEAKALGTRDLSSSDYVYLWVDGIHLKVRLEQEKLCLLVMIGVRADGRKEPVALTDGFRESTESWADLLRDCRRRGMAAPVLAVGDGALGFWKDLREVLPGTREQRCCFTSRPMSFLHCRNRCAQVQSRRRRRSTTPGISARRSRRSRRSRSTTAPNTRRPSPRSSTLPTCYEFCRYPAEYWIHLHTANPIESTFATVYLRTRVTKGPGSRAAGLAMSDKLIEAAQTRWCNVNAPELVALVRAGAVFHKGKLLQRPTDITPATESDQSTGSEEVA